MVRIISQITQLSQTIIVEHIIHQHDSSTIQLDPMTIPEAILLRKKHEIHVYGSDVMHPMRTFAELFQKYSIHSFLQKNINKQMFEIPTPIQMQSFPIMLEVLIYIYICFIVIHYN